MLAMVVAPDGTVRTWRGGPGWDEDDVVTLEEYWRRWMRAGRLYLDPRGLRERSWRRLRVSLAKLTNDPGSSSSTGRPM